MEIKDILKNRRLELGLTLVEVAEKVGVNVATVSRWESGDIANMRRDRIKALADALRISPAVIMGWEEPKPEPRLSLADDEVRLLRAYRTATEEAKSAAIMVLEANRKPTVQELSAM